MNVKYLALGDSYTIGEAVATEDSFPFQLTKLISENGISIDAPRVIAKTGWTTDELDQAIAEAEITPPYQLVTLLIGVNNQYRGRSAENFSEEFQLLLSKAMRFADNQANRVFVISIPDWGVTPFGEASGRDLAQIAAEIDAFNAIAKVICTQQGVDFSNITPISRLAKQESSLNAEDGLHPSASMYGKWIELLLPKALVQLK